VRVGRSVVAVDAPYASRRAEYQYPRFTTQLSVNATYDKLSYHLTISIVSVFDSDIMLTIP
jgi:hypothetical protein